MEGAGEAGPIADWIAAHPGRWSGLLNPDARNWTRIPLSLGDARSGIAQASACQDRETAQRLYDARIREAGANLAIGAWMEHRTVYATDNYRSHLQIGARRDHHLGYDLFAPAGTPVFMPMQGTVVQTGILDERLNYGGFLVTAHRIKPGVEFFALWGHLSHASDRRWSVGEDVPEGVEFAHMGDFEENGWWLPHLHLQLSVLRYADFGQMPRVGEGEYRSLWSGLFPNPSELVLGK